MNDNEELTYRFAHAEEIRQGAIDEIMEDMMNAKEQAAAVIQCRTSWPQAEGIAEDLERAGLLKTPPSIADLGMFTVDIEQVIADLRRRQTNVCAYGTTEGDGQMCDCKFLPDGKLINRIIYTDYTGCPELRQAIRTLEWINGDR